MLFIFKILGINCGTFLTTQCSHCIFHNNEYRPDNCGGDCYLDPKIAACKETAAPDSEGWILREEDSMETMRIILLKHLQNMKKVLGLLFKNSGWD